MGVCVGHLHEERSFVSRARHIIEVLNGVLRDQRVKIDLHRAFANAGNRDTSRVIGIAFALIVPVGSPCKIGGVEIRRQPLLKAMMLIWPDEMHLARQ